MRVQAAAVQPQELERLVQEGRSILLRTGVFDPLVSPPTAPLRTEAIRSEAGGYLLAQFTADLTERDWKALEGQGAKVLIYIPSHSYIIRVADDRAARGRPQASSLPLGRTLRRPVQGQSPACFQ